MPEPYDQTVRDKARDLYLAGDQTDEQIARRVGVQRVNTIRDWRREGGWEDLRRLIEAKIALAAETREREHVAKLNTRHDQLGEAIEGMILRCVLNATSRNGTGLGPRDIRLLAAAAESAQRLRRTAAGADVPAEEKPANVAVESRAPRTIRLVVAERPGAASPPSQPSAQVS